MRGTPISYNRPVLNFDGEYAAGTYYQNSAETILSSRKHPRTQKWVTNATWFTPTRGGLRAAAAAFSAAKKLLRLECRGSWTSYTLLAIAQLVEQQIVEM